MTGKQLSFAWTEHFLLAPELVPQTLSHTVLTHIHIMADKPHCVCVRKYADPRIILEMAYNLTYSWHKYSRDADCFLFIQMLMGVLLFILARTYFRRNVAQP